MVGGGLAAWLRSGVARSALVLSAFGIAVLAAAPAQACFFIQGGTIGFNPGLTPPCPAGFFDNFGAAQAALDAMMGGGGPTTTPPPTATPTAPTTAPGTPATTPVTADNVRQILGPSDGLLDPFDALRGPREAAGPNRNPFRNYMRPPDFSFIGDELDNDVTGPRSVYVNPLLNTTIRPGKAAPGRLFDPDVDPGAGLHYRRFSAPRETAPPTPQDRVFFQYDYFGTPLPTIGTGRSAAGYEFDPGASEILIRLNGVSDNGLQYGARIGIPLEEPAQPSPSPDELRRLESRVRGLSQVEDHLDRVAMILYADEASVLELYKDVERYRELVAAGRYELTPEQRRAIRDVLRPFGDPAEAAKPLDEAIEDLKGNPISDSGDARLSGGLVLLGAPPAAGGSFTIPHALEVAGQTREGVPFDFQLSGVGLGEFSGPPAVPGGPPVVQIFTFGEEGQPQGVRYVADVDGAISAGGPTCPQSLSCEARKATIGVDETGGFIGLIHQISGSAPAGAPPPLLVTEFTFTPTGDVQGTRTLFDAPPQPAGLPPIRLPVAQVQGAGSNLSEAAQRTTDDSLFEKVLSRPGRTAETARLRGDVDELIHFKASGGRAPFIDVSDANLGLDYRVSGDSPVSFTLDVFDIFAFDPPVVATPAEIQPNGSAASMLFGPTVGGVGVTSNGVQFSASLRPSDGPVVTDGQELSLYYLDFSIDDPAGGRGAANAGAPPPAPSEQAFSLQPGHARGQFRIGARGERLRPIFFGPTVTRKERPKVKLVIVGPGVLSAAPSAPTYNVRIDADPAQAPARPAATSIFGYNRISIRDNAITADFDVDVRGAERLTERGCQGAGLDCGGSVRNVTFSFNAPDGPPIVDVAIGLDAEGRPAARDAAPNGILIVTLSPNGGAGLATAKVFQNTPGEGGGISLVDVGPAVPIPPNGSPEERLSEGIRLSLESVGPQPGRIALNQADAGGGILLPPPPIQFAPPTLQ